MAKFTVAPSLVKKYYTAFSWLQRSFSRLLMTHQGKFQNKSVNASSKQTWILIQMSLGVSINRL